MFDGLFQKKLQRIERRGERQRAKQELIDKYAQYYPSKRRKVSNVMLAIIVVAIVVYAVADLVLQYFTGSEISSTLTTCWFAFWGSELALLAGIKTSKVFKSSSYESTDDESMG